MADMRKTARQVLDEMALVGTTATGRAIVAGAGQTPEETAALKRYGGMGGAAGGTRSAEWIQKNLGAAGLTSRELASRYYVPGVRDAGPGDEVSRGRTGVTLAQVMALPKEDLDRAVAMKALTAAELDTRRYARMVTEAPKEVKRSGDVVDMVAKVADRADLTPEDKAIMVAYVSGLVKDTRRAVEQERQRRFGKQEARYAEEVQKEPPPVAGGEERFPRQPYPFDSGGHPRERSPSSVRLAIGGASYPPSGPVTDKTVKALAAKALYEAQVDELPMLAKPRGKSIKVDPYEAAKARKWLVDTGQLDLVFTEPVTDSILRYKKVKGAEAISKRSSILY